MNSFGLTPGVAHPLITMKKIEVISMPLEEMKLRGGSLSVRNLQLGAEDVDGIRALTVGR